MFEGYEEKEEISSIQEYYATKRMSNSLLGLIQYPAAFKARLDGEAPPDDEAAHLRIGSALDCLLTSPDRWYKDFKVADANRPYGAMGVFTNALPCGLTPSSPESDYMQAYELAEYKLGMPTVIRRFWSNDDAVYFYRNYVCADNKGKTVLGKTEYEMVIKCRDLILNSPFTKPYFQSNNLAVELLHQVPIYFEYSEIEFKSLLDGILINHDDKTILPFDLKTTGKSVFSFRESFLMWGYYRQCALYWKALFAESSPVYHLIEDGYKILDFEFIVVEKKLFNPNPPLIYRTTALDRRMGFTGGYSDGQYYKGIDELIDTYKWHLEKNYWDLPKDVFEKNAVYPLDVFDKHVTES